MSKTVIWRFPTLIALATALAPDVLRVGTSGLRLGATEVLRGCGWL